jgi:hypothetical protein
MDRKFPTEDGPEFLRDIAISQRREMLALIEHRDFDPQSRQRLCQFQPKRTGTDDRDRTRERREFENRLVCEHDIAQRLERLRNARV